MASSLTRHKSTENDRPLLLVAAGCAISFVLFGVAVQAYTGDFPYRLYPLVSIYALIPLLMMDQTSLRASLGAGFLVLLGPVISESQREGLRALWLLAILVFALLSRVLVFERRATSAP